MTTIDMTGASDAEFAARVAAFDAAPVPPEVVVETVARALWDVDNPHYPAVFTKAQADELWAGGHGSPMHATYVARAAAAIAALPPSPAEQAVKRVEALAVDDEQVARMAREHEAAAKVIGVRDYWHTLAGVREQSADRIRVALASPAPAPQGEEGQR